MFEGCGSFTSRIQVYSMEPRNYNVQPRMVGGGVCVGGEGGGGNVIATKKSSTAFSEPKLGPPP